MLDGVLTIRVHFCDELAGVQRLMLC